MSKEWYESREWAESAPEQQLPREENTSSHCEISRPTTEYVPAEEYFDQGSAAVAETAASSGNSHKKKMRKILYGLTSMVMVVSMSRTISGENSKGILSDQPVWFSIYDQETQAGRGGVLTIGGGDSIGGVGHVSRESRHVDYYGNPIEMEVQSGFGYNDMWLNAQGYTLADTNGNDVYSAFDNEGKLIHKWKDSDLENSNMQKAALSDNNKVFLQREVRGENGNFLRNSYYTINGQELFSSDCSLQIYHNGMARFATPFRDGVALCNDDTGILLVEEDGNSRYLVQWPVVNDSTNIKDRFGTDRDGLIEGSDGRYHLSNVPCVVSGSISQGYFAVTDTAGSMALVNVETGEMYPTNFHYAENRVEDLTSGKYVLDLDNEGGVFYLGTLMCATDRNDQNEVKFYLFDVTKHCDPEGKRTAAFACYDAIYFEDYQYLAVREGQEYFYIDLEGNKVSETYQKASSFNDFGYALVQDHSGAFYVIDNQFNKLEQVRDIDDFHCKDVGEVFWVTCGEEPYSYYYGPELPYDASTNRVAADAKN